MSSISEKEAKKIVNNVTSLISSYGASLKSLEEMEHTLCSNATALSNCDGVRVAGSSRCESTEDYTKYYYDIFSIKGSSAIVASSNNIMDEAERLSEAVDSLENQMKNMDSTLAIIAIYISSIEKALNYGTLSSKKSYEEMSMTEKLKYANKLMEEDKKLKYYYLNRQAIRRKIVTKIPMHNSDEKYDSFDYLEFYNKDGIKVIAPLTKIEYSDKTHRYYQTEMSKEEIEKYTILASNFHYAIMQENNKYSDKFKASAIKPLKQITLEYIDYDKPTIDNSSWAAYADKNEDLVFDMNYASKNADAYNFQIAAYSHELGHSYDYTIGSKTRRFSSFDDYLDVYNQINNNDSNYQHIREYGHSSPTECFAECTQLYYNNPQELKEIEIEGFDVDNLYEYMKNILE